MKGKAAGKYGKASNWFSPQQIQTFLTRFAIEEPAATQFWQLPPNLQSLVMDAGSLADARNPTAVLSSRMKKAMEGTLQVMEMKPGDWKCPNCLELNFARNECCRACQATPASIGTTTASNIYEASEVETFLEGNLIEEHAANTFRELAPELQSLVIEAGSLADARDPTAVLMSRVKKAQHGTLRVQAVKPGDWNCPACGDHNFARNDSCRRCGHRKEGDTGSEIDDFLTRNAIEAHAVEEFRELAPELQVMVMDAGSLADARDPTAVLRSRMTKAKQGTLKVEEMRPGDWKCKACGDHNFAKNETCRKCYAPRGSTTKGTAKGGCAGGYEGGCAGGKAMGFAGGKAMGCAGGKAMGKSFFGKGEWGGDWGCDWGGGWGGDWGGDWGGGWPGAWACGKAMGKAMGKGGKMTPEYLAPMSPASFGAPMKRPGDSFGAALPVAKARRTENSPAVEEYLKRNGIQEPAFSHFLELPSELQGLVMDAGSLADARDPTAVLVSRMKKAQQGTLEVMVMRRGDWKCSECFEHNFARNEVCRACGASPKSEHVPHIEQFLETNQIEDHAATTFRELSSELQNLIIEAGSLADARDPTAVLMSRINKARQGMLRVQPLKPGDWNCLNCGDHNFARNETCRRCGAPKPQE